MPVADQLGLKDSPDGEGFTPIVVIITKDTVSNHRPECGEVARRPTDDAEAPESGATVAASCGLQTLQHEPFASGNPRLNCVVATDGTVRP